ncbi:ferritin-like domain-containing protein [Streptomyces sp. NPDC047985]|uniref:ferritin-like domain-containing protein n=1 Tax=Streptomyces sp. NPDC047985 TaxID=3155384 RepID=UPI00341E0B8E
MSDATREAAQAALAAEHAAVYGYGVLGGRVAAGRRAEATAAYHAHRSRRDALVRTVRDLGAEPVAARAAYALPFAVPDAAAAVRLAAVLEDRVADVYSDLVRAAEGPLRRQAADALRESAVRAVRWRGSGVPFPGLVEHTADGSGAAAGAAKTAAGAAPGNGDGAAPGNGPGSAH